jgi:hypothetical protein
MSEEHGQSDLASIDRFEGRHVVMFQQNPQFRLVVQDDAKVLVKTAFFAPVRETLAEITRRLVFDLLF